MLYKLYGIKRFDPTSTKHPRFFAKFTRSFIFHPLANSRGKILELLDDKNPVVYANGGRRYKLFQFLSEEVGMPALRAHLAGRRHRKLVDQYESVRPRLLPRLPRGCPYGASIWN